MKMIYNLCLVKIELSGMVFVRRNDRRNIVVE